MTEPRGRGPAPGRGSGRPAAPSAASKPAAPRPAAISPARAAAFDILERVGASSAHSDDLLHGPRLAKLSQPDRDLTTALVLGVLRWQIALDARIRPLLSRPDATLAEPVAIALRLGAFQLLHLERIPAHAALNESVELVRQAGHPHAAGMVNAILRKLVGAPAARRPLVEPTAAMAERLGHPLWLVEGWERQYGKAAVRAICEFDQQEPPCAEIFDAGQEGLNFPVMDAGSRLVAELAAAAAPEARRVWDCCAAPGGKTIVLAKRLEGAELLATDVSPVRLKRLAQRLERELPGRAVRTGEADASALPAEVGSFDLILCDVPCSGTGTLARNPEIRHRLWPEDLDPQVDRQQRILNAALERLAPGGRLVYSTCSLEAEECQAVVAAVTEAKGNAVRPVAVTPALEQMQQSGRLAVTQEQWTRWVHGPYLRTLPGVAFQGDGFFAAILERA